MADGAQVIKGCRLTRIFLLTALEDGLWVGNAFMAASRTLALCELVCVHVSLGAAADTTRVVCKLKACW